MNALPAPNLPSISKRWAFVRRFAFWCDGGGRLFAFKNKKKDLSCEELAHGRKEADAAPAALRSNGTGLTPAQVSRGAMLAHDVGRELGNEYNRRCKKG